MVLRPRRIEPGPGQESVWDYPRPPAVQPFMGRVEVLHRGAVVADSTRAVRILETSQPPAFYVPPGDVAAAVLRRSTTTTWCEWKGRATYWDLVLDGEVVVPDAGWSYEAPSPGYGAIINHVAFYAQRVDDCWVNGEQVVPNPGAFYGGWVTSHVVGPFKGDPGTATW